MNIFKKEVKRIKMGRKVISSLVQFGSFDCVRGPTSPAPVQGELVPDEDYGRFPKDFTKCWMDLGHLHIALALYASFDGFFSPHSPCQLKIRSDTVQAVKQPEKEQTAVKGANFN